MRRSSAHALHAIVLLLFLGTLAASVVCSPGIGPVSADLSVLIQPPSWVFVGAWSVIYILCLVFCVWQFFPGAYLADWADIAVNCLFCAGSGLCVLWIVAFSARMHIAQAVIVCTAALTILAVSGILRYRSKNHALRFAMNVFSAWMVLASVLGVMASVKALSWAGGDPDGPSHVHDLDHSVAYSISLSAAILAEAALSAWLICPGPSLVALWGLAGVGTSLYAVPMPSSPAQADGLRGLRLISICGAGVHLLSLLVTSLVLGYTVRQEVASGDFSWSSCGPGTHGVSAGPRAPAKGGSGVQTASLARSARSPAASGPRASPGPSSAAPLSSARDDTTPLVISETTDTIAGSQTLSRRKSPTELSTDDKTPPSAPSLKGWLQGLGRKRAYVPLSSDQGDLPS